jgi:O-antigen/teichoic acid export membrane protein
MVYARKFLANYTLLVAGDLASKLIGFWAMVHIARVFGKDLFGGLAFAAALSSYFSLLVRQGLDNYGVQEVARNPASARRYADSILGIRVTGSVIAFLALVGVASHLAKPGEVRLLLLLGGLMYFPAALSLQWVFQAVEEMRFAATAAAVSQLAFAILVLTLLDQPSKFYYVPVFQFAGELLAVSGLLFFFARRWGFPRPTFRLRDWGAILRESIPMGLSLAFGVVLFNFDMVLLGFWRPPSEVGEYSAAYRFIGFFSSFIHLYSVNLLPLVSRCRGNPGSLRRVSDTSLKYSLLLAIPLAAGGTVLASPLMNLVFGTQFSAGAGALQILIWAIPLMTGRVVLRATLLSHGLQKELLRCTFLAAVVNAGLNILLIPRFTYLGSAVATLAAECLYSVILRRRVAGHVAQLPLAPHVWKPVLACIPMALLVHWLPFGGFFFRMAAGAACYFSVAWLIGAFSLREIGETLRTGAGGTRADILRRGTPPRAAGEEE